MKIALDNAYKLAAVYICAGGCIYDAVIMRARWCSMAMSIVGDYRWYGARCYCWCSSSRREMVALCRIKS